jgi:hypothetical protein
LNKINIQPGDSENEIYRVDFSCDEIKFLKEMIAVLDQSQQLSFQTLSVVKKILNNKE